MSEEEKLLFMESYYGRIKWSCSGGGKGIIKLQDKTKWFRFNAMCLRIHKEFIRKQDTCMEKVNRAQGLTTAQATKKEEKI